MTSQVNLADTASLLTEVTNVFALSPEYAGEDLKLADKLLKTNEQVTQAFDEKQAEIKEIIREYSSQVSSLEEQASFDAEAVEQDKAALEEEKKAVIESIHRQEEQCAEIEAETARVKLEAVDMARQLDAKVRVRDTDLPEAETKLQLYKTLTNIVWSGETLKGGSKVAGFIANGKDLKNFDFEHQGDSQTADRLWAVMDGQARDG